VAEFGEHAGVVAYGPLEGLRIAAGTLKAANSTTVVDRWTSRFPAMPTDRSAPWATGLETAETAT
jgi:hypothetical protein